MPKAKEKKDRQDKNKLNAQQELFCRYYTQNRELFGNATLSYAEAYNYKLDELPKDDAEYETEESGRRKLIQPSSYDRAYNVCGVEGSKLLKKPKAQDLITKLLNELMRDEVVDAELVKVIVQDKEKHAKVAAIKVYNDLKARITKKVELTGANGEQLFSDDHKTKAKGLIGKILRG